MKREGLWEKLRLLNPKNLQREVHVYGYRFRGGRILWR